jgi:hypothetical protein
VYVWGLNAIAIELASIMEYGSGLSNASLAFSFRASGEDTCALVEPAAERRPGCNYSVIQALADLLLLAAHLASNSFWG